MKQQNAQKASARVSVSPQPHVQYGAAQGQPAFQALAVGQPPSTIPAGGYPAVPQVPAMAYPHRHHQLQLFWKNQMQEIERVNDFKNHQLPLARIKKIMKADEDVRMISAEAPVVFAKACEMFILELTLRSWINTEENKRRTLQKNDIGAAISCTDIYDFLVDVVPRDELIDDGVGAFYMNPPVGAPPEAFPYGGMYYMPPASVRQIPGVPSAADMPGITVGRLAMPVDPAVYMQQPVPDVAHPSAQQLQEQLSSDTSANQADSAQQARDGEQNWHAAVELHHSA